MLNAADLSALITVLGCSAVAGLIAVWQKAGWLTLLCVIGGLAVGFALGIGVNKLAYRILHKAGRQTRALWGWLLILAYTFVPIMAAFAAMALTGFLTLLFMRLLS